MLEEDITRELEKPLEPGRIKTKQVPNRPDVSYLESYDIIDTANRIFGYGQWGTSIKQVDIEETGGKTICVATIRLDVQGCLPREDVGAVVAIQSSDKALRPEALETAIKGAVSDAMKRAFRHFGNQFGNSLYGKDKPPSMGNDDPGQIKGVPALEDRKPAPDAETLRGWIHTKVANKKAKTWTGPISEKQIGLLNRLLTDIFGTDEDAERERHQFLEYMFDTLTSKTLTKAQASVLIDWAKDPVTLGPHPVAIAEGQMVIRACAVEAGQTELPL